MVSIVVADSAFLAREGFKTVIGKTKEYSQVGEIASRAELEEKLKSIKPDILVIDPDPGDILEIEELDKIQQVSPKTKTLVISGYCSKDNVLKILKKGVFGYLTRECGKKEILHALDSVVKGEKFICNKIVDVILKKELDENNDFDTPLTEREIEIIKLITEKYSNQEIAEKLFISINTVYTHRKNIMKKLQLKSPVELILYAIDSGIIQPYQN